MEERILILALRGRDSEVISRVLAWQDCSCEICTSVQELARQVALGAAAAILTEESLKGADLGELEQWLANQEPWSDFPIILLATKRSGSRPSSSVQTLDRLGNVVILERPIHPETLESAVKSAARGRRRQYDARARMLALRAAEQRLTVLNASLEERIIERTRALSEANNRLTAEIAERERAQAALVQSQKVEALGQLTGGIAHDFNNLLAAVMGSLQLIQRKADDSARVRALADSGLEAAQRGAKLTGQLLAFSRAQRLHLEPLRVSTLISEMRDLLSSTAGPLVSLKFDLQSDDIHVMSDRTQFEMALLNLVINARDAMPDGGRLMVSTKQRALQNDAELESGDYVELSVADSGCGMPPDVLARAFDPFFTTKELGKGTGLGLSQTYALAKHAGGTVRISSEPGEGTTVRLYLPQTDNRSADAIVDAAQYDHEKSSGRILVVDDDKAVRQILCESLQMLGFDVAEAPSGREAIALLDAEGVDLAIVDYAMPEMNGAEVAAALRKRHPQLRLIFVSGYSDTAAIEAAVGGDVALLRKPFSVDELRTIVHAAMP